MQHGDFKPGPIQTLKIAPPQPTLESLANARAEADPLPGPLLNAFMPGAIKVADVYVRKFVAYDHVILKALDSPLRRMMLELSKPEAMQEKIESTDQEEWDLAYQFTHPVRDCAKLIEQSPDLFRTAAKTEIGMELSKEQVNLIILAVFEQVKRTVDAANRYAAEAKEGNEITFLGEPTG